MCIFVLRTSTSFFIRSGRWPSLSCYVLLVCFIPIHTRGIFYPFDVDMNKAQCIIQLFMIDSHFTRHLLSSFRAPSTLLRTLCTRVQSGLGLDLSLLSFSLPCDSRWLASGCHLAFIVAFSHLHDLTLSASPITLTGSPQRSPRQGCAKAK